MWQQIVVGGDPNLQLIVTSQTNGGTVYTLTGQGGNLCAYVDTNFNMPQITAVVSSANGGPPPTGTAAWQLSVTYNYTTGSNPARNSGARVAAFDEAYDTPVSATQAANQPYTLPGPADGGVHVGWALLAWEYSPDGIQPMEPQPTFIFKIYGTNPDATQTSSFPTATAVLSSTGYWFAQKMALHETNMSQFCQQSLSRQTSPLFCSQQVNDGLPVFGPPSGYGMMQMDPATQLGDVWNFNTNVQSWTKLTNGKPGPVNWAGQVNLFNKYNNDHPQAPAAPPQDVLYSDTAGNTQACHFTMPIVNGIGSSGPPSAGRSFADADIIKELNGLGVCWTTSGVPNAGSCPRDQHGSLLPGVFYGPIDYITFNSTHLYKGDNPHWQVVTENSVDQDTVAGVCSCTGPPRNCTGTQTPTSSPPPGCWPGVPGYDPNPKNPNNCPRP